QLRYSFSKAALGQKSKKRRKQVTIRVFFWDNQVISFLKEWDEIQIQRVCGSGNPKTAIRSSGCNGCSNSEMSILFLRVADNRLVAYPQKVQMIIEEDTCARTPLPIQKLDLKPAEVFETPHAFRISSPHQ